MYIWKPALPSPAIRPAFMAFMLQETDLRMGIFIFFNNLFWLEFVCLESLLHLTNINYNDVNVNVNSSDNNFPTFYTNINYSDQQPTSNENISAPVFSSYAPQYVGPQQPIENIPSSFGSFNMTNVNPSQSQILSFDIPGFKIIVIPTSSQQQDNTSLNYSSSNITNNQFQQ
ncbi:uncharacterized protein OCT59_013264 [Rhizophagus irregularis]|uniref:uncharacterized protein n=1 Tax=Rhizophagus irregularis TaxID=588596 RepID=UPI0033210FBE|nr:hypothetical protein OCT59_013264 [Rhizophagus irregularis]